MKPSQLSYHMIVFCKTNLELSLFFVYSLVGWKELLFVKTYLTFYFYFAGQPQDARIPVVLHRMWRIGKWLRTLDNTRSNISYDTRGGEGTPKDMVFAPFWSENGCRFCLLWSEFGYDFRGNAWTYLSFQFQRNKKERIIREFEVDFKKINFSRFTEINSRYFGLSVTELALMIT